MPLLHVFPVDRNTPFTTYILSDLKVINELFCQFSQISSSNVIIWFQENFSKFGLSERIIFVIKTIKAFVHTLISLNIKNIKTDLIDFHSSLEKITEFHFDTIRSFVYMGIPLSIKFLFNESEKMLRAHSCCMVNVGVNFENIIEVSASNGFLVTLLILLIESIWK